jgi:hypothetical protein
MNGQGADQGRRQDQRPSALGGTSAAMSPRQLVRVEDGAEVVKGQGEVQGEEADENLTAEEERRDRGWACGRQDERAEEDGNCRDRE